MSREFEVVVTDDMAFAFADAEENNEGLFRPAFAAALAHPDFRAQLRAWAAEEMRGLVADEADGDAYSFDRANQHGHNECRAETLANIERWRNESDD